MDTRTALLAAAAALLLAGAVGAVAAPDAIVDPREADERPGDVRIVDTVVSPGEVRGETAELRLGVDLRHRGSAVENVTVRHRAIGADSGLLVDETTVDVGTVDGGGERTINGSVDVEREGGYRIETSSSPTASGARARRLASAASQHLLPTTPIRASASPKATSGRPSRSASARRTTRPPHYRCRSR